MLTELLFLLYSEHHALSNPRAAKTDTDGVTEKERGRRIDLAERFLSMFREPVHTQEEIREISGAILAADCDSCSSGPSSEPSTVEKHKGTILCASSDSLPRYTPSSTEERFIEIQDPFNDSNEVEEDDASSSEWAMSSSFDLSSSPGQLSHQKRKESAASVFTDIELTVCEPQRKRVRSDEADRCLQLQGSEENQEKPVFNPVLEPSKISFDFS